jgi:shikimate dehydrogenase
MIGARTGLYGVIGWPIAHSKSPDLHNSAFHAVKLDLAYMAFAVPPERLEEAIAGAGALGVRGLNVTIPHKEAALALCEPDAIARAVGAVNTIAFADGRARGTNTDVHGFAKLAEEAGADARGRAVILGAGGAARAVAAALLPTASGVTVVSRGGRPLEIGGAATAAARWPADDAAARALFAACDLLIDATPRGLDPAADALDLSSLPPHAVVLDLVVRRDTALTRAAHARGLGAQAGAAMLLHQGAAAFEYWLGVPAPLDVMRAALDAALDRS